MFVSGVRCNIPKNIIQNDSYGVPRLMFPLVIKHMQKHFSCSDSDFGGPMVVEVTNSTEDEEEDETEVIIIDIKKIRCYELGFIVRILKFQD